MEERGVERPRRWSWPCRSRRRASSPKRRPTSGPTTGTRDRAGRRRRSASAGPAAEAGGPAGEQLVGLGVEQVERGQAGGGRQRVPGQRAGLVHGPERRQHAHDVGPAAERADRQAAADHLAEAGEVGADAEQLLGAAAGDAEAGDHLVEDQQRADAVALGPQALRGTRAPAATRPMLAATGSTITQATSSSSSGTTLYGATTVSATASSVTPAEPRQPERRHAAAALGEQRVAVAVVVAGELHDLRPAGEAAGHADGRHGRLGARADQADLLALTAPAPRSPRPAAPRARSARRRTCRRRRPAAPPRRSPGGRGRR